MYRAKPVLSEVEGTPATENPNIERGPADRNKPKKLNPNYKIRNGPVWNIEYLVLIIWICFGFRIWNFELSAVVLARVISLPIL